jgi:hypothetical protein
MGCAAATSLARRKSASKSLRVVLPLRPSLSSPSLRGADPALLTPGMRLAKRHTGSSGAALLVLGPRQVIDDLNSSIIVPIAGLSKVDS